MSAFGGKADIQCPLFESYPFWRVRMSAFGGKADVRKLPSGCLLIATSGHSTVIPTAWILRSLVVSLLGEGERAWNAGLPPFLPLTWPFISAS